ncbi:exodeoxyribonuclease V subunit beta [Psychrosphaera sp. F3M07]|uniref:exodeoxyribonuclease V subunit beta n=1 Tax=Psychrosphaera sp. F3M07 TaxID=2841560 RepID=UPI001C0A436B|nr:exodeoxyribonuclease V subunit beta [Psychrosphaera sp. F3M07]MBU2918766.1 exodeoxyribonuclease V subunit beta [Psychrosphaera sp. F3M07]
MNKLNPLTLPLDQNALIEASAGTGKTYTITTLYLRALLGLVDTKTTLSPKSIEQILVVTFTEAATQEIRDRVRKKLLEAQQVLLTDELTGDPNQSVLQQTTNTGDSFDSNLVKLLNTYIHRLLTSPAEIQNGNEPASIVHNEQDIKKAVLQGYHRLQNAITLIDEASIFTIHGFCHRCIKQFAFETNSSFEQTFEMDNKPILQGALYDFWRKHVVPLDGVEFGWFEQNWRNPEGLYKAIASVLGKNIDITPALDTSRYNELINDYQSLIINLKQEWKKSDFSKLLAESDLKKTGKIYKRIGVLTEFVQSDNWFPEFEKGDEWGLWGSDSLNNASNYKAKSEPLHHPISQTIDKLAEVVHQLKNGGFQSHWLRLAKDYIENRAQQIKNEQQIINPDDLLTQLLNAINATSTVENVDVVEDNNLLLQAIRTKYPLAFIDEFQDTDPVQYGIFNAIYNRSQDSETTTANMILIGDPKQAIYKFRGADIFTYIKAKQDLADSQHYTLDTNWRSHPKLVNAVNQVFKQSVEGFKQKEIPFESVLAGKSDTFKLIDNGKDANQLTFCHLLPDTQAPDKVGFKQSDAEGILAKWCASQIQQTLLSATSDDPSTYIDKQGKVLPVQANDICILVRNRNQASVIKKTLAQLNIRSVFISRDNIFNTAVAKDLLRLLMAINSPFNEQKVRAACATCFFAYDIDTLFKLQHDPVLWQQHLDWFYNANQRWVYGQISSAIDTILLQADTLNKWQLLEPNEYERLITDQRHLSELIQQQSVKHAGVEKLLHWFEQQVIADDNWSDATDDQQLRLESDSSLVQIATLHASKGLEYPIVYLPFVCDFKAAKTAIYTSNQESKGLTYRVDNRTQELQQAEAERLAEDLRLLYVAMTRPIFNLVIGVYNLLDAYKRPVLDNSGLGQVLLGELATNQKPNNELIEQACNRLLQLDFNNDIEFKDCFQYQSQAEDLVVDEFNQRKSAGLSLHSKKTPVLSFSQFSGNVNDNWKMISYSSLVAGAHHSESKFVESAGYKTTDSFAQEQLNDIWVSGLSDEQNNIEPEQSNVQITSEPIMVKDRFSFPKGANAGTCLHWIMENLDFQQPVVEQVDVIESGLTRYGIELSWVSVTIDWMKDIINCNLLAGSDTKSIDENVNTPDQTPSYSLADIEKKDRLVEMEFYFNFNSLNQLIISNALQMMGLKPVHFDNFLSASANQDGLSGIVKGFIDLTVHHKDKYYVLDYKSNYLGDDLLFYNHANLEVSMSDHHYQIQALIYTLALHRWLKSRLPHYDYNVHVGGALYLFLRGMQTMNNTSTSGVYVMNIKQDVIEYLDAALEGKFEQSQSTYAEKSEPVLSQQSQTETDSATDDLSHQDVTSTVSQMGFDFD